MHMSRDYISTILTAIPDSYAEVLVYNIVDQIRQTNSNKGLSGLLSANFTDPLHPIQKTNPYLKVNLT